MLNGSTVSQVPSQKGETLIWALRNELELARGRRNLKVFQPETAACEKALGS